MSGSGFHGFLSNIWADLGGDPAWLARIAETGEGVLPSVFDVSGLAAASTGAASLAAAELIAARHGDRPASQTADVHVDRRLASLWFDSPLRPEGWTLPAAWDSIAGDYATADGWIRLHTNAPHHKAAALRVLGVPDDKDQVTRAVAKWSGDALETAVVAENGCAAMMRSLDDWTTHPQGRAVAAEPLVRHTVTTQAPRPDWTVPRDRPLRGIRVLDLTRVLAGPVSTRFLAGLGAEVLRIDPPAWDEPSVLPGVMPGKRAARLDLREPNDRATFEALLQRADVLVHGYRSDALGRLGLDTERLQSLRPGLVDVALDAYGWTGPWRARRGFDSLVQMSTGIAEAGMRRLGKPRPHPLPVQAVDHACGHLMAAAALRGLTRRLETGLGSTSRLSLARAAALLVGRPADGDAPALAPVTSDDLDTAIEATHWGPGRRLRSPVEIYGTTLHWDRPAGPLGSSAAAWLPA